MRQKLALIAFTLIVTYALVFVSGFGPQHRGPRRKGIFQQPLSETALAYVVSLVVAFVTLSIFNQIGPSDPREGELEVRVVGYIEP